MLTRLGQKHELWLLSVDDRRAGPRASSALGKFCERHAVFPLSPLRRYWQGAGSLLKNEPVTVGWFHHPALAATLESWLKETKFDAAVISSSAMAPYWLRSERMRNLPVVMDFVDVDSERWAEYARYNKPPKRWIFAREQRVLADLERDAARAAAWCLFVSESEVESFDRVLLGHDAVALANGVDGEYFARPQLSRRADPPHLVFVGKMDNGANEETVVHFVENILPKIQDERPEVCFDIVGPRPTAAVRALAKRSNVVVTGWVEDFRPHLWRASVFVVPLRMAQGTQNKVLEAMAASLPVVASSLAARGIMRPHGPHIRVADTEQGFARQVLELLDDEPAARLQAHAALQMVHELHSWDAAAARLSTLLQNAQP